MFGRTHRYCISCNQQHDFVVFFRDYLAPDKVYEFICPATRAPVCMHICEAEDVVDDIREARDAIVLCEVALSRREQVHWHSINRPRSKGELQRLQSAPRFVNAQPGSIRGN
jgi:hypothetical protein